MADLVGVSFPQPWPWLVLSGMSQCEVPLPAGLASPPGYRGPVLLHAAETSHDDFDAVVRDVVRRRLLPVGVPAPWRADLPRGGFVGRARIVEASRSSLTVLDVDPLPVFVPAPAGRGLFPVDDATFRRALEAATAAENDEELAAVVGVWTEPRPRGRLSRDLLTEARA